MLRAALFLLIYLLPFTECPSQTLADTARTLTRRVSEALTPGEPVQVSFRNLSGMDAVDVRAARQSIEAELRSRPDGPDPATVVITFTQGASGYLWVAELARGGKREQVFIEDAGQPASVERHMPTISLRKILVWEQDAPILDVAVTGGDLIVLTPSGAAFYARQSDAWTLRNTIAISPTAPWPRDLRGRVLAEGDSVRAFLPGLVCSGGLRPEPSLVCNTGGESWPGVPAAAVIPAGRNYFSVEGVEPFFSAARVGGRWILTLAKGGVATLGGATIALGEWGGDITAVESPCGAYVLAVGAEETAMIHALAISDGEAFPVGDPLALPGRLTALWPAAAKDSAVAISKDMDSGRYAAFNVSITCGH